MAEMETPYYCRILKEEFAKRVEANLRYSLRAYAKSLEVPVSALSEVLSSKRVPSYKLAMKIGHAHSLNPQDLEHFVESVGSAQKAQPERQRINRNFRKLDAGPAPHDLSLDLFRVISDWYHYAILFLTEVEDFRTDTLWISKQIGITQTETRLAIERMMSLGLLVIENGRLTAKRKTFTTADKHISTPALRKHVRQMLEKAIFSLENDPIEKRSMTGMTFAIDPGRIPEAKEMIAEFTRRLARHLEGGKKKKVYEYQLTCFRFKRSPYENDLINNSHARYKVGCQVCRGNTPTSLIQC